MTRLSDNLTARRKALNMSVPKVHAAMNRLGFDIAFSTVAGWFNGSRGIRNMKHMKALCDILQTDLNALTGDEAEVVEGKVEVQIVRELSELDPTQRETILAVIRGMKGKARS